MRRLRHAAPRSGDSDVSDAPKCGEFVPVAANALNIEVGAPSPRCRLKTPDNWATFRM